LIQDGKGRTGTYEELSKDGVDFESLIKSIKEEKAIVDPDVIVEEESTGGL